MGTCSTFTLGWLASNLSIQRFTTSCRLASFSICHSVRVISSPDFASPPWLSAPPADTFEAVVLEAANLGEDADTTAAIAGQLAGAFHGARGIPERWLQRLALRTEIQALADALHALNQGIARTA